MSFSLSEEIAANGVFFFFSSQQCHESHSGLVLFAYIYINVYIQVCKDDIVRKEMGKRMIERGLVNKLLGVWRYFR